MFNRKGLLLIPQKVNLQYLIFSYAYSRYESSIQGNRVPPSSNKGGPSFQQPESVLGVAGTHSSIHPPSCYGKHICTKASTSTKPDQPAKGKSHKLCAVEVSSIVFGKTGIRTGRCTSLKFQITSGDANHFPPAYTQSLKTSIYHKFQQKKEMTLFLYPST